MPGSSETPALSLGNAANLTTLYRPEERLNWTWIRASGFASPATDAGTALIFISPQTRRRIQIARDWNTNDAAQETWLCAFALRADGI